MQSNPFNYRARLPWSKLWLALPYPIPWLTVVLIRGITDGWVPYGLLLPQHGTAKLALALAALLAALLCVGVLTWVASRLQLSTLSGDRAQENE